MDITMADLCVDLQKCRVFIESKREETRALGERMFVKVRDEVKAAIRIGHECPNEVQELVSALEYKICHS